MIIAQKLPSIYITPLPFQGLRWETEISQMKLGKRLLNLYNDATHPWSDVWSIDKVVKFPEGTNRSC